MSTLVSSYGGGAEASELLTSNSTLSFNTFYNTLKNSDYSTFLISVESIAGTQIDFYNTTITLSHLEAMKNNSSGQTIIGLANAGTAVTFRRTNDIVYAMLTNYLPFKVYGIS